MPRAGVVLEAALLQALLCELTVLKAFLAEPSIKTGKELAQMMTLLPSLKSRKAARRLLFMALVLVSRHLPASEQSPLFLDLLSPEFVPLLGRKNTLLLICRVF